jgi:hypothetical protein
LTAMILADSSIPARCWTAPLIPTAMYRAGRTVVPVWPIFSVAHYGIVGDLNKVLPMMVKALRERR